MGLSQLIADSVQVAFHALGDLVDNVVFTSVSASPYDPDTGVATDTSTPYTLAKCALVAFKEKFIDGAVVQERDKRLLFPLADLAVVPKTSDYVTIGGVRWNITRILTPHRSAIHVLQVREE